MKIISWNVNGVRAWLGKEGSLDWVLSQSPDIFCIQESKAMRGQVPDEAFKDFPYHFWNSAIKKGYSGTVIFSKIKPMSENYGLPTLPKGEEDTEGRVITLEFKDFYLVNVYTPNTKPDLARLEYRYKIWDKAFLKYVKNLNKKKEVIFCGDLNVAHNEIDLKNPKTNKGGNGFTDEERRGLQNYIDNGFVDTFRELYPERVQYSWWSYRFNARKNNTGWRIDYFFVSSKIFKKVKESKIADNIYGSDHCPTILELR